MGYLLFVVGCWKTDFPFPDSISLAPHRLWPASPLSCRLEEGEDDVRQGQRAGEKQENRPAVAFLGEGNAGQHDDRDHDQQRQGGGYLSEARCPPEDNDLYDDIPKDAEAQQIKEQGHIPA